MNITLKQLQVFLSVARHENLALAAQELFLTRGAVSQSLQELEKQLGLQLFDRVHPCLRLNHEGMRLRPLADEILHRCHEVETLFANENDLFLHVGVSKTIGTYVLPQLLRAFEREQHWLPRAHIANTSQLLDLAASFALDVVLFEGESTHSDIVTENWLVDEMAVLAPRGHPLTLGGALSPEALAGQRWILREPHSGTREYFEHSLGRLISPYRVVQSLDSPAAVLGMVAQGLGITFASKMIAELPEFDRRFAIIPLTQSFSRTFRIGWHSKKYHSASMEQFISFCRRWVGGQSTTR